MNSSSCKVQKRSKNFTGHEKTQFMQIIRRYAPIIENKKADAVSVKEKVNCWEKIKTEFNATTTEGSRDVQSLNTFYQNSKRSLKKERAEKNKEGYISILEKKLDNRGEGVGEDVGEEDMELEEALQHLETVEKNKTKKTGGGSYSPILPTGADAILGELLADQLQPLSNSFDDGAQYFALHTGTNGNVNNSQPENPSSSVPKRKKKIPVLKRSSCIKKKIYERKLFLVNLEIKHKDFSKRN